jgi:hypothetical protein
LLEQTGIDLARYNVGRDVLGIDVSGVSLGLASVNADLIQRKAMDPGGAGTTGLEPATSTVTANRDLVTY